MAAKHFPPFITRLRRKVDDVSLRLAENYTRIELQDNINGFTTSDEFSEETRETRDANTAITATEDNYTFPYDQSANFDQGTQGELEGPVAATDVAIIDRTKTKRFAVLGIVLAILSSFLLSIGALMIKLAESIPSLEVTFMRMALQLVFSIPPLIFFKDKLLYPWKKTWLLILRGVVGATAMNLGIYAVKHMPMADARVITYTSPVYTVFLGRIFLKETVSKFDLIATLLSLGGVVLIGRPTFLFGSLGKSSSSKQVWYPTVLAVIGAFCGACTIVLIRKVCQAIPGRVVVFYSAVIGLVVSLVGSLIAGGFKYPDCGTHDVLYIISVGFIGYTVQLILAKALSLEKASIISLVCTVEIAFSFLFQLLVLGVTPNALSIGGAFLVLLCNVTIFIKKILDQRKIKPAE